MPDSFSVGDRIKVRSWTSNEQECKYGRAESVIDAITERGHYKFRIGDQEFISDDDGIEMLISPISVPDNRHSVPENQQKIHKDPEPLPPVDYRFDGNDNKGNPILTPLHRQIDGTIVEIIDGKMVRCSDKIQEFYKPQVLVSIPKVAE